MTDKNTTTSHNNHKANDTTNPFVQMSQNFKTETQHVLEETTRNMERAFVEYEKGLAEMNKLAFANMKLWHEAGRAMIDGMKVMTR